MKKGCMTVNLREITALPTLMYWRAEVLRNVLGEAPSPRLLVANRQYYQRHMSSHMAFVAEADGVDCGCGAVCFYDELPSPDNPSGRCAYLMNIYVRKEYRERGIAHLIVHRLVKEALGKGCGKIYLETTNQGQSRYCH